MALFQDPGGNPRERFAAALSYYGELGDDAAGNARGFAARKAGAAVAFARHAKLGDESRDAIVFAATLHAIGAIDAQNDDRFDAPVFAARRCAAIAALPERTAEIVRAQSECWDGTGFPDELRGDAIPLESQLLLLADVVLRTDDMEDALDAVNVESGRSLSPGVVKLFAAWLRAGNEIAPVAPPAAALGEPCDADALVAEISGKR